MYIHWLSERRRNQILAQPFPDSWRAIIVRNLGHWAHLSVEERGQLEQLVQVFVAEKSFEGCAGLELDDEMRVTIAANACMLLLGLPHDMYRDVESILVYPSTVVQPRRMRSIFDASVAIEAEPQSLLGEAHTHGPIILAWDAVHRGSRGPGTGHNVVFHEFAHKLDMLDGSIDGTPPLRNSAALKRWAEVCSRVYLQLRADSAAGKPTFLDPYGGRSEAEFFAVATEFFFDEPVELRQQHADLYGVLQAFYQQDPAQRVLRASGEVHKTIE
jgi:Mlc titration factor MtfA (ptsG expression regulator)